MYIKLNYSKIAFITDPHGHYETLKALIAKIPQDHTIILGGDYIDKGPRSKEILQYIIDHNIHAIMGNHDHLMTVESNPNHWKHYESLWMYANHGKSTIKSYGSKWKIQNRPEIKKMWHNHLDLLNTLPLIIHLPNLIIEGKEVILSHSSIGEALQYFNGFNNLKDVLLNTPRKELLGGYSEKDEVSDRAAVQSIFYSRIQDAESIPDTGFYNIFGHNHGVFKSAHGHCMDNAVYKTKKMKALLCPSLEIIEVDAID